MADDMSVGTTIDAQAMEEKVDSLGITTIDHVDPSNVLHVIRRDTGMETVHTRTELISNFVLVAE